MVTKKPRRFEVGIPTKKSYGFRYVEWIDRWGRGSRYQVCTCYAENAKEWAARIAEALNLLEEMERQQSVDAHKKREAENGRKKGVGVEKAKDESGDQKSGQDG